jgi:hypothetical protein
MEGGRIFGPSYGAQPYRRARLNWPSPVAFVMRDAALGDGLACAFVDDWRRLLLVGIS